MPFERSITVSSSVKPSLENGQQNKPWFSTKEERKLVRKISFATMPFLILILIVQFIDKFILNFAAVLGLYDDTHITQTQFNWLGSIFYAGFLFFQIPNQYLVQRLPVSKYYGVILSLWGVSLAVTALAKNFQQLAALRFVLGFFEGSTSSVVFLLVSTFYRRTEQVFWFGALMGCNFAGMAVAGLLGYGMGHLQDVNGLSAWQWSVIIWGSATVVCGILLFFFLPDTAKSRWFYLTDREKKIIDERILDNATIESKEFKIAHIYEALKEPRLYCYVAIQTLINLQNGCTTIFSSQIIHDMGFTQFESILLNIPIAAATALLVAMAMYLSHRFGELCYVAAFMTAISLIAIILLCVIPRGGARLVGIILSSPASTILLLEAMMANNVIGYTKKVFYLGMLLFGYCLGNFLGPLMMIENEAPRYVGGMTGYAVADSVAIALFFMVRYMHKRKNQKRDAIKAENGDHPGVPENRRHFDWTDVEDVNFRYRL
ncbi:major facilitator superfamily domain-containing protein [Fennellomyces sp. T-0311]|nr:major facilitator superfamily domain-containing protein [Fennellomyces sp. T-0311]